MIRIKLNKNYLQSFYLAFIPITFLLLFYFYPLSAILKLSLFNNNNLEISGLSFIWSKSGIKVISFTFLQAMLSTVLTLLIALPAAWLYSKYNFATKTAFRIITTIPFVLPTMVVATAFQALLAQNGFLNQLFNSFYPDQQPIIQVEHSLWFILLAHVFYNYSLIIRIVGTHWEKIDSSQTQAAHTLGANPWQTFTHITLPTIMPAIASASLLIFIFCFSSFGIILILGGSQFSTIEVEIYRQTIYFFNLPTAAGLAIVQLLCNFIAMWTSGRLSKKYNFSWANNNKQAKKNHLVNIIMMSMAIVLISPLFALLYKSLAGENGFTISYYLSLFQNQGNSYFFISPLRAGINSISTAISTMLLSLAIGLPATFFLAKTRNKAIWDGIIMLPVATSAVTLGLGYIIALDKPPLNLRDSGLLILTIAHCLIAFPFFVRCLLPSLQAIPENLKENGAVLGASPQQTLLLITLPLVKTAVLSGMIFSFAISMGEFGAAIFLSRPENQTLPIAIFSYLGKPGQLNHGQAMAMSVILMLITGLSFLLMELTSSGRQNEPVRNKQD